MGGFRNQAILRCQGQFLYCVFWWCSHIKHKFLSCDANHIAFTHFREWPLKLCRLGPLLLADGVPRERILVGGVFDVLHIWDRHGKTIVDWKSLPKWTYDPTRDTHRTTSLDELANSPLNDPMSGDSACSETSDSEGDDNDDDSLSSYEDLEDSGDNDIPYVWPSDTYRYEALAYSTNFKALAAIVSQDQRSVSEDSTMAINFRTPRRILMGQPTG